MNELVKAIRENKLIGRGSCSIVDECKTDKEIIEDMKDLGITTPEKAVKWYIELEGIQMDKMMDQRWGEDNDPEFAIKKEWDDRVAKYEGK